MVQLNRLAMLILDELESLHLGNIARHRLRPSDYEDWRARWQRGLI